MTEDEYKICLQNQRLAQGLPAVRRPKGAVTRSEAELERVCTQMLEHDGWRSLKTNPVSRRARGAGFGELGMCDYMYWRYNVLAVRPELVQLAFIEWKRPGGVNEPHQRAWQAAERAKGATVWVAGEDFAATPDDFWNFYCRSGLRS